MSATEYRYVISSVYAFVCDDVSTAAMDVSGGAVPLLLPMRLVVLHVEGEPVKDEQPSTCPPRNELSRNCEQNHNLLIYLGHTNKTTGLVFKSI